jgi:hypothetical protein
MGSSAVDMSDGAGVALIVAGAAVVAVTGFVLRRRLPAPVVVLLVAGASVAIGAGALVVQDHTTMADWVVALGAMAVLGPLHIRVLVGPFGPGGDARTPATEPV